MAVGGINIWTPPAVESGKNPVSKHEQGQGNLPFPFSVDHEQDWQPYPADPVAII